MPGPPDDDDAPRWEPPAPSTEVPRWEPPPAEEIPRWTPPAAAPLRPGLEAAAPPAERAAPAKPVSLFARPFVWWKTHPWIVVWALVLLVPGLAVALRVVDESEHQAFVAPLAWAFLALGVAALVVGVLASAGRSAARAALGVGGALAVAGLLLWPVTRVTLGRTPCPPRAGPDLGAPIAAAALKAWRQGAAGDARWQQGRADAAWNDRARAFGLLDYRLVDSGCWERVAPVDGTRTWHEFRVTVQRGGETPLSKVVVVHTAAGTEGWKITAVEGPLP
jgi:hypothetical protein